MRKIKAVADRRLCARLHLAMWIALSAVAPRAFALNPGIAVTQYTQRTWQSGEAGEGLPQNSVFAIEQTRDGYIWLGTQEGLARFDGVRFEVFSSRNTAAFHHNDVWKLLEDRAGNLWIGTRGGGLVRYRDGRFEAIGKEQGLANDAVQALWQDRVGSIWVGTRGGGLSRYWNDKFSTFTTKDGLASDTVYAVHEDRAGNLWIGTDGAGLSKYANGTFTTHSTKDGLSNDTVYAIFEDAAGRLWIGTGAGLNRYADGKFVSFRTKEGLPNDNIRAISEDRDGNLWIGTDGGGLVRFKDGRFSALTTKQGLSNDSIGAVFEDREGSLWIGTDAGGLVRLKDNHFISYSTTEGLANDNARSVLEDRAGNLWIGTFGGLDRLRDGVFTHFGKKDGLSSEVVLSLLEDRDGALWAGTLGGGLNRFKDGRFRHYGKAQGLSNDTVLSLLQDQQGTLWAGTRSGGLNRLDNGRFRAYGAADGLPSNDVRVLHEDRAGTLWIGTLGGGLVSYRDGKFTAFTKAQGLSSDLIFSIHEDAAGTLWIGTFGGGLNRFKDGRFTAYTTQNGLADDVIFRILEDDRGNLWMSSNSGVHRVSRRELDNFADGRAASYRSVAYGKLDGMRSNEANGAHQPAGWRARDGRLWFPTIAGVVTVDPARLAASPLPPPVVIEQLLVNGKPVSREGAVSLPPGRTKLDFRYTGLSFLAPEKVRFSYMLEGFDHDWVDAGKQRSASYTNLPPGRYRFLVKAANGDGVWNQAGAALGVELQPFFWQTRAFYFVYVLLAALLVAIGYGFHHIRVRWLRARERALLQLVDERKQAEDALRQAHDALQRRADELVRSNAELERFAYVASHDLKEPLRAVVSFSQLLAKKYHASLDDEARQYIAFAVDAAHSMRVQIENLLAYSRVGRFENEVEEVDCGQMLEQALANLRAATAEAGATVVHEALPLATVHPGELVQLLQNLVANAIKFRADAPPLVRVSAMFNAEKREWLFGVADNGIGIDPQYGEKIFGLFQRLHLKEEYPGTGIGLAVCKKIIEGWGGRIWVESALGTGSRFWFTLPAARARWPQDLRQDDLPPAGELLVA